MLDESEKYVSIYPMQTTMRRTKMSRTFRRVDMISYIPLHMVTDVKDRYQIFGDAGDTFFYANKMFKRNMSKSNRIKNKTLLKTCLKWDTDLINIPLFKDSYFYYS